MDIRSEGPRDPQRGWGLEVIATPLRVIRRGRDAEEQWLKQRGFDGLACLEHECGCASDDLYPCGDRGDQDVCVPAFLEDDGLFYQSFVRCTLRAQGE